MLGSIVASRPHALPVALVEQVGRRHGDDQRAQNGASGQGGVPDDRARQLQARAIADEPRLAVGMAEIAEREGISVAIPDPVHAAARSMRACQRWSASESSVD